MSVKEVLPYIVPSAMFIIALFTFLRSGKKDNTLDLKQAEEKGKEQGKQEQTILLTINQLSADIKEIKENMVKESTISAMQIDIDNMKKEISELKRSGVNA